MTFLLKLTAAVTAPEKSPSFEIRRALSYSPFCASKAKSRARFTSVAFSTWYISPSFFLFSSLPKIRFSLSIFLNFSKNDLDVFAGINLEELNEINVNHAKFKVLSAEHYLKVYSQSRRDGYRVEKRGKQDQEKINQIKNFLEVKTR